MTNWDIKHLGRVRAVALDVDGTIAGHDHRVNPRTVTAIAALQKLGIPVVLLTGRSRRNTQDLARQLGITNEVVCCNGAVVFNPVTDEDIRVVTMKDDDVSVIKSLHRDTGLDLTWWTVNDIVVDHDGPMRDQLIELNEDNVQVAGSSEINTRVVKMMLYGPSERLDEETPRILRRMPQAARSMSVFFEFVDPNANKWEALQFILPRLGLTPAEVLGLGDGGNDTVWLSQIGHPIAMGNARPEVLDVTRHTTGHHAEDGAAEILELACDLIAADLKNAARI